MLRIYLVQMEVVLNDKAANFKKVKDLLAASGCRFNAKGQTSAEDHCPGLIVLPEMFATGYIPEDPEKYAEDFSNADAGETAKFLSELANETGCAVMGAGISFAASTAAGTKPTVAGTMPTAAGTAPTLSNHSSVYLPGNPQEYAGYNKRKPFFPEVNFVCGDKVNLFKINQWNIAAAICYDLRFPELFRDAVKAGAQLMAVQAAWPAVRKEHWITLLKARAIENQMYIAAVNQTTVPANAPKSELPLGGNSMIISPMGEIIACATDCVNDPDGTSENVISVTIYPELQEEYRRDFPVLKGIV